MFLLTANQTVFPEIFQPPLLRPQNLYCVSLKLQIIACNQSETCNQCTFQQVNHPNVQHCGGEARQNLYLIRARSARST